MTTNEFDTFDTVDTVLLPKDRIYMKYENTVEKRVSTLSTLPNPRSKNKQTKPRGWTHSPFLGRFGLSRGVPKKDWPRVQAENEVARQRQRNPPIDPRWPLWMSQPCHLSEKPYLCLRGVEACADAKICVMQRLREYRHTLEGVIVTMS